MWINVPLEIWGQQHHQNHCVLFTCFHSEGMKNALLSNMEMKHETVDNLINMCCISCPILRLIESASERGGAEKELEREGLCFKLGWQEVVAEGQSGTLIPTNKECWKTRYPFLIRPRWWIGWRKANRDKTDPWWQQTNFDVILTLIAVCLVWADVFEQHGKMAFNLSAESVKPQNRQAEKKTGWPEVEYSHNFYKIRLIDSEAGFAGALTR